MNTQHADMPVGISHAYAPVSVLSDETLDRGVLAQFRYEDDLPDFVISLIDLFILESTLQVDSLKNAAHPSNFRTLRATAHSLKGSSMTLGANRLGALCAQLEVRADQQDEPVIPGLIADIGDEFMKVRSALLAERPVSR